MTATIREITLDAPSDHAFPTAEFVTVTPGLAREWLGRNEGNRNLKNLKIAAYSRDILANQWMVTGEAIKFDWNGRLIDGQNRLHAIIRANRPAPLLVVRGLDPESQKVLDTGAKRTAGDALKMSGHSNNPHVMAATIRLLLAWESGELATAHSQARDVTHSEILEYYFANSDLLDMAISNATRWYGPINATTSPLATVIFLTSRIDAEASYQFFKEIHDLDLGGKGNPKATLYKRLKTLRQEKSVPAQQIYFMIRAWNAWREGAPMTQMKDSVAGTSSTIPEPK